MNFFARIGRALTKPLFEGAGGATGGGRWNACTVADLLGLPVVDGEGDVGELWKSSIPLSCLKFEQRAAIELDIVVQRNNENGDLVNAACQASSWGLRTPLLMAGAPSPKSNGPISASTRRRALLAKGIPQIA